jgi:hypothetical protein
MMLDCHDFLGPVFILWRGEPYANPYVRPAAYDLWMTGDARSNTLARPTARLDRLGCQSSLARLSPLTVMIGLSVCMTSTRSVWRPITTSTSL